MRNFTLCFLLSFTVLFLRSPPLELELPFCFLVWHADKGFHALATNVLLSGNNYNKIALLFKFMDVSIVAKSTFFAVQVSYCVATIKKFWQENKFRSTGLRAKDHIVATSECIEIYEGQIISIQHFWNCLKMSGLSCLYFSLSSARKDGLSSEVLQFVSALVKQLLYCDGCQAWHS